MVAVFRRYRVRHVPNPEDHYFYRYADERDQVFWASTCSFSTVPVRTTLAFQTVYDRSVGFQLDAAAKLVRPGRFLLINAGQTYQMNISAMRPVKSFSVHFCPETLDRVRGQKCGPGHPRVLCRVQNLTPEIQACMARLAACCESSDPVDLQQRVDQLLHVLLAADAVGRRESDRIDARRASTRQALFRGLCTARDHIHARLGDRLTTTELAAIAGMSRHHFQRQFRGFFGASVGAVIRSERMWRAGELLLAGDAGLIEIAAQVGYAYHQTFTRAFARYHGVPPQRFKDLKKALPAKRHWQACDTLGPAKQNEDEGHGA